jgi:ABC-type polysaccharide/polyol phosphate export permease
MLYTFTGQLSNIWRYRELAVELFWTYLKLRHAGSILGFIWTLLNTLLYILTYWIVFSLIIRMGLENYPLFLIPGYLAWTFTLNSIVNSSESILQSKDLITKIAFPNEIIVLTNIAVSLVDFVISLFLFIIILLIFYPPLSVHLFFVPIILILQLMLTIGLCMIVACVSVFFKDVPKLVIILGQVTFFLTPIFYPLEFIPSDYQSMVLINPIAQIIHVYHNLIYYEEFPDVVLIFIITTISFLTFLLGFLIFNRLRYSFAELS